VNYAIVSAVHGRPAIAEAWAAHLAKHFTGPVVVAGDDEEIRERMFTHLGEERFRWVPYCNEPLGAKWNRAAEAALHTCGEDYMLVLGSDDFPSPGLLQWYDRVTLVNPRWACLGSLYFHCLAQRETSVLEARHSFGTGRLYNMFDFANLFRVRGYAWEPALGKGLDLSLWKAMGKPREDRIVSQTDDVWCMAVKSAEQIWSYDRLKQTLNMPVVETLPESAREFLKWIHEQPGVLTPKLKMTVKQN
jgi:hypothetical protein